MAAESGPDPVEAVAETYIAELTPDQHRILAYASAIGREFDFALLVAAMETDEEGLAERLEELVHRGLLRERAGGDRFLFVRDETRAAIYQSLTASRLRVLHRKVGEAMERLNPDPGETGIADLGRHFFLGKVPDRSLTYNRRAAVIAEEAGEPEVALHHLERVRLDLKALGRDGSIEEVEVVQRLGVLRQRMGDLKAADRAFGEASRLLGDRDPAIRAQLLLARGEAARRNSETETASELVREAHELFSSVGDVEGTAKVHRLLGRIAFQRSAYREALDEAMAALDQAQSRNHTRLAAHVMVDIGDAFARLGPETADSATDWYNRALDRLEAIGDIAELARAHLELAQLIGPARPHDALEHLEEARTLAERAHEPEMAGWALLAGVECRLALGQAEEAERENQQATRLFERNDRPLGVIRARINSGLIREKRGQWDDAEASYSDAIARADGARAELEGAEARFLTARLLHKTRDDGRARELLRAAAQARLPRLLPRIAPEFEALSRQLLGPKGPDDPEPTP